jgi:hypothetical protein
LSTTLPTETPLASQFSFADALPKRRLLLLPTTTVRHGPLSPDRQGLAVHVILAARSLDSSGADFIGKHFSAKRHDHTFSPKTFRSSSASRTDLFFCLSFCVISRPAVMCTELNRRQKKLSEHTIEILVQDRCSRRSFG